MTKVAHESLEHDSKGAIIAFPHRHVAGLNSKSGDRGERGLTPTNRGRVRPGPVLTELVLEVDCNLMEQVPQPQDRRVLISAMVPVGGLRDANLDRRLGDDQV